MSSKNPVARRRPSATSVAKSASLPALLAWIKRDSVTAVVPLGITVIEMGPFRPRRSRRKYGVQRLDD